MTVHVIGVDCATTPARVGLAFGVYARGQTTVTGVTMGSPADPPGAQVARQLAKRDGPVLLALDAPLGWPVALAAGLHCHAAGAPLETPANDLFRRETDRFIRRRLGKQSLDVGADRIARTAHAALALLQGLRCQLGLDIPLAWSPALQQPGAIEVYPAATLAAYGMDSRGYRAAGNGAVRERLLGEVQQRIAVTAGVPDIRTGADGLDAVLCLLAAHDFLTGKAMPPEHPDLARREGWMWVRDPG